MNTSFRRGVVGRRHPAAIALQRRLSQKQAWNCERAIEARCRCRCNGLMHGAKRMEHPQGLYMLPADDPHFLPMVKEHELGPMRRVIEREHVSAPTWMLRKKRGVWRLKLECGHFATKKLSRRPPKKLHCRFCKAGDRLPIPEVLRTAIKKLSASRTARKRPNRSR